MMFAGTLGGNATLIGASANVVAGGICASQGKPISFVTFMRYGVPLTICQLVVSALYVLGFFYFAGALIYNLDETTGSPGDGRHLPKCLKNGWKK